MEGGLTGIRTHDPINNGRARYRRRDFVLEYLRFFVLILFQLVVVSGTQMNCFFCLESMIRFRKKRILLKGNGFHIRIERFVLGCAEKGS